MSVNLLLESSVPPPGISKPMTAGADPQPVESSTAPKMPSITSIRNIPHILDHNYGQPPPMTPPDSNSPGPEDIDTGNEDEEDDGVTRCICGFDHDDGYMICCDKCSVWQHIECMGISSDAVPESYLCDQCQPRTLDRVRARAIQERKKEELSDDDDDDEESEEERDTPSYTAISNTPTRITLTTKVTRKRKRGSAKMKVKQDVNILTDGLEKPKKPKRRRRSKQQKPPTTTFVPVDEETSEPWDSNCNSYDQYEEVKENIYSQELEQLALNSIQENGISPAYDGDEQRCKVAEVQRCRKGIVTTEDMDKNSFIIQCKGKVMLLSRFESENQFFKRFFPFVLYYSKLDHLQLCVDARTRGNDARFVRRSCCPTAEVKHYFRNGRVCLGIFSTCPLPTDHTVKHYFHNGRVCLGIFSTCPLPTGHEVTIPFEFPFDEYHSNLDCACAQDGCAVTKYNSRFQNQNHDTPAHKRFKAHDEDSNSSHNQKMSPLRVSLSNSQGLQGDSDSDIENNPENRRKKSREERKLEAYLKQIEKMEKKEKRKQQTQKEHKHEVISPVSQEVTVNKLGAAKSLRGMKRSFNKRRSGMPGLKKRHGRLSSCSSEPLSPEEHSSTASTPTTPKVTSASSLPDEPCYVTPSSSPNRNFKFPKGTKQIMDEEFKETPIRETPIRETVKVETAEHSGASSPNSPVYTPRDDIEMKPVLSTASSTTDLTPDAEPAVCESTVPVSVPVSVPEPVSVCTSTVDSGNLGKDFSQSLTECLVEINSTVGSGRNTPSPCPSTTGSPTSAESVTSGYSGSAAERTSPGPAPGSPVASVKFGQRAARSNPLYGSLKKRWLFQYLCEQKLVNDRLPNGFKVAVTATITTPMNGKTIPSSVRRNGLPKILDPLPLKKRHLKKYQSTCSEPTEPAVTVTESFVASEPPCDEPLIVSSPVALEQQVQIVLADSVNDLQPHKEEQAPSIEQLSLREETKPLRVDTSAVSNSFETSNSTVIVTHTTGIGVTTSSVTISQRRPSDPRLVNISPVGSTYPVFPPSSGGIVAALSVTSPVSGMLAGQSASPFGQSGEFSSGTPGKKKVSLLEYRNRSRNRLSIDTPRTAPPHPSPVAASSVVSPAVFSPSVIKSSASLPNLSLSASSSSVHRPVVSSGDVNGPHLEPVSPDVDDKSSGLLSRFTRMANSAHPYARASHSMRGEGRVMLYNEGDSRLKREIQKKHELLTKREEGKARLNEKLTSIISVQLQKDTKSTPSVAVRSPSTSSSDSSHHPLELSGDAMEIEDEDSNSNSNMNIYINTPVVPASVHAHSAPVSHRPSLLAQLTQPNYRLNIPVSHGSSQPPIYLSTGSPQLPSPSQPPQRLSGSSPQYLVTSPSGPAHVRFQSPYQTAPSQPAGYYHH